MNFTRLFHGVANNARTMIWMICGHSEGGAMEGSGGVRSNRGLLLRRVQAHLPNVIGIACIDGVLNATVNRYGVCSATPA